MGPLSRAFADLAAQLAALAGTRLELFGLEARDAGDRLLCRLAALLAAAVFLLLALLVATLALALVFWPTEYRFLALGLLALLYAVLGAGLACWLVHRLRRDPDPFAVTAEVLREDAQALAGATGQPEEGGQPANRAGVRPAPDDSIPGAVP
ncbi:phage holin family protein [Castellaniella ginsengisoli]|uniref:Phage holin family protein n=1 Tax=Castellaniella ginsengisoli TaxID=546114 RepID=A0AB39FJW3_9BURK